MTREEAITIMQVYKEELEHRIAKIDYDVGAIDLYSIQVEAYNMAIEALSAEAVSREDYHNLLMASNDIDRALREYQEKEESASADAVEGWITDRNPAENGTYMVTIADEDGGFVCELHYGEPLMPICNVNGKCWYDADDEFGDCPYGDIIAWMPLPTPYKAVRNNECKSC